MDWIDDPDSRVNIVATALGDLRGIVRLGTGLARGTIRGPALLARTRGRRVIRWRRRGLARPRAARRSASGSWAVSCWSGWPARWPTCCCTCCSAASMAAQAANALSLLLTAVANTAANRRVTFGVRGRARAARHQVRGLIAFAIGLALTSGALAALHAAVAGRAGARRARGARRGQPRAPRWCGSASTAAGCSAQAPAPAVSRDGDRGVSSGEGHLHADPARSGGTPGTGATHRARPPGARPARRTRRWARPALLGRCWPTARAVPVGPGRAATPTSFYAAAVQAGTKSWKAFFFGSLDARNLITVDKTAGVAVGDGAFWPDLRVQLLVACWCRRPWRASPPSALLYAHRAPGGRLHRGPGSPGPRSRSPRPPS